MINKSLLVVGLALIIAGLLVQIHYLKGFIQLQPLHCPRLRIPFA